MELPQTKKKEEKKKIAVTLGPKLLFKSLDLRGGNSSAGTWVQFCRAVLMTCAKSARDARKGRQTENFADVKAEAACYFH